MTCVPYGPWYWCPGTGAGAGPTFDFGWLRTVKGAVSGIITVARGMGNFG